MTTPTQPRRYDCRLLIDFAHEYMRMCNIQHCEKCRLWSLFGTSCNPIYNYYDPNIMQQITDIVQAWSDAHPEEASHA